MQQPPNKERNLNLRQVVKRANAIWSSNKLEMPIWNSELWSINLDEQSSFKEIYCCQLKYIFEFLFKDEFLIDNEKKMRNIFVVSF
jgi:hypothetical protein